MTNQKPHIANDELAQLLAAIHTHYGYDFTGYSKDSIHRRVLRFMDEVHLPTAASLEKKLLQQENLFASFLERITVNVTEMFRDPEFYQTLREQVLPALASFAVIKIWSAGCASGEEAFSIAILLEEAGLLQRTRIYATDINPYNIEQAKKGVLPLTAMKSNTSNYIEAGGQKDFASYYTARYNKVLLRKEVRSRIVFSQHNLVTDQVFNEFQLILCRNVLIYFDKQLQNKVIHLFYDSLSMFGYLALGMKESLLFTSLRNKFGAIGSNEKIFRKEK